MLEPSSAVTMWLALDEVDEENLSPVTFSPIALCTRVTPLDDLLASRDRTEIVKHWSGGPSRHAQFISHQKSLQTEF